ncbi:MAG TPA: hypothetical protein VGD63_06185 [Steroidobacteraceae bacterium]
MLRSVKIFSAFAALLVAAAALAQAPAGAPAGATGLCKDGSYWTGATKRGACHGHKGVQDWYAATPAAPAASAAPTAAAPAVVPAAPPAASKPATTPEAAQAPGGGAGQVWVNTSSKVYHCPSDRWYGKTKKGAYMSEADAIAKGNRADHGKACHS